jgi:hypothetical protein
MNTMPGISVRTNNFVTRDEESDHSAWQKVNEYSGFSGLRFMRTFSLDDWIVASIDTRNDQKDAYHKTSDGTIVLLDGYISIPGNDDVPGKAEWIARRYLEEGRSFIPKLHGSFTCLIYDHRCKTAVAFNDRLGSRPLFYRQHSDDSIAVGPEVRRLAELKPVADSLDNAAVIEFLICGNYFSNRTLFENISKVPQASILTITPTAFETSHYWTLCHHPQDESLDLESTVEECHRLLLQSIDRILNNCPNPFLFLSGGLDSRLILGLFLERGVKIPVATYGTGKGDDYQIARKLAGEYGLPLSEFQITFDASAASLERVSEEADCRAEVVDTPSLNRLFQGLSEKYSTFVVGDVIDTVHTDTTSDPSALDETELYSLGKVVRLSRWISNDIRLDLHHSIANSRSKIEQDCDAVDFVDLFECIYYKSRLANLQNGFAAYKMRYFEQARPLLDEDLVDLFLRLPRKFRANKFIYHEVLKRKYPGLARLEFARVGSLLDTNDIGDQIISNLELSASLQNNLQRHLDPRLKELFDTDDFTESVQSLISGKPLPAMYSGWLAKIPGVWRILPKSENRVHPVKLILRLLQIQLYLSSVKRSVL